MHFFNEDSNNEWLNKDFTISTSDKAYQLCI